MQETQEMQVGSLGWENPVEEEMATHCSILVREILWREEPGRLQSMGSQSRTLLSTHAYTPNSELIQDFGPLGSSRESENEWVWQ